MILLLLALGAALVAAAVHPAPKWGRTRCRSEAGSGPGVFGQLAGRSGRGAPGFVVPSWLPWTLLGIVAAAALAGVVVLWTARSRRRVASAEASATSAAVEAAIDALDAEADPLAGRCRRVRPDAAHARRARRCPVTDGSAARVLELVLVANRASERDATTLTGLFEEARYSSHPIPERLREVALATLRSLRGGLRAEGAR